MTTHRVTTVFPGLDTPLIEDCDCAHGVDHVEVYPAFSELVVLPIRRAFDRFRPRHDQEGS